MLVKLRVDSEFFVPVLCVVGYFYFTDSQFTTMYFANSDEFAPEKCKVDFFSVHDKKLAELETLPWSRIIQLHFTICGLIADLLDKFYQDYAA